MPAYKARNFKRPVSSFHCFTASCSDCERRFHGSLPDWQHIGWVPWQPRTAQDSLFDLVCVERNWYEQTVF